MHCTCSLQMRRNKIQFSGRLLSICEYKKEEIQLSVHTLRGLLVRAFALWARARSRAAHQPTVIMTRMMITVPRDTYAATIVRNRACSTCACYAHDDEEVVSGDRSLVDRAGRLSSPPVRRAAGAGGRG